MKIVKNLDEMMVLAKELKSSGKLGFVPTMGALHEGHLSLVEACKKNAKFCIVSIFVNPTQFNNKEDLVNYPNTLDEDLKNLENSNVDVVYLPSESDIYGSYDGVDLDLGELGKTMEGEFRPGHFKGVVDVVYRFFDIVNPNIAFFGLKDFQQVAVIQKMVSHFKLNIEILPVGIKRESNGLAMSSRNLRLTQEQREDAAIIYSTLRMAKEWRYYYSVDEVIEKVTNRINDAGLNVEYTSIVDKLTLQNEECWTSNSHVCVVAFCGEIRLLDNEKMY